MAAKQHRNLVNTLYYTNALLNYLWQCQNSDSIDLSKYPWEALSEKQLKTIATTIHEEFENYYHVVA